MGDSRLYLTSGILEHWHSKTLEDYTNCPKAKRAVESYIDQAEEAMKDGVGLYLWGANGTGKSHLMMAAFKQLIDEGFKCQVITLSTLITKFTGGWYDPSERKALYKMLCEKDFLGIEEIGKEFKGSADLPSAVLDSIIKYRVQRNLPTWATSNLDAKQIKGYYTEDIASMLKQCCLVVQVTGKDYRDVLRDELKRKYEVD